MTRKSHLLTLLSLLCIAGGVFLFYFIMPQQAVTDEVQITVPQPKQTISPASIEAIPFIDLEGNSHILGDWKQPVLIVNFWAPWCVPCRREVPALIALQKEFETQVQILGLVFDSAENAASFATDYGMNYPSFLAGSQISMYSAVFGNRSGALPFTAIIDQARTIRYTHTGELSLSILREEILKIL